MRNLFKSAATAALFAGVAVSAPAIDYSYETLRNYAPDNSVAVGYFRLHDFRDCRVFDGLLEVFGQSAAIDEIKDCPEGGVLVAVRETGEFAAITSMVGVETLAEFKEQEEKSDGDVELEILDEPIAGRPAMVLALPDDTDFPFDDLIVIEYEKGVFVFCDEEYAETYVNSDKGVSAELDAKASPLAGNPAFFAMLSPDGGAPGEPKSATGFVTMPDADHMNINLTIEEENDASAKQMADSARQSLVVMAAVLAQSEPELGGMLMQALKVFASGKEVTITAELNSELVTAAAVVMQKAQEEADEDVAEE